MLNQCFNPAFILSETFQGSDHLSLPKIWNHAFITSQLDYSNSLLSWKKLKKKIPLLSPAHQNLWLWLSNLASPHWLPLAFKLLLINYKALRGLGPSYLADPLVPYVHSSSLRSSDASLPVVPRSWFILKGDWAFVLQRLWNELSEEIRAANFLSSF